MNKTLVIASVLMAAALTTGIFSTTTTAAVYADDDGDYSGTDTEQKIKQKNVGGDNSEQFNCAQNNIGGESALRADVDACGTIDISVLEEILGAVR